MAPTLVTTPVKVEDTSADTASLVCPSFTPAAGELLVVKAANSDAGQTFGTPTNTGFTVNAWTQRVNVGTGGSSSRVAVWTAQVTASAAGQITVTVAGGTREHSMTVERWQAGTWQLAATPATVSFTADATSPFTGTCTTAQNGSVISWAAADWNGGDPSSATLAGGASQEVAATYQSGIYTAFWCTQAAPSSGPNTTGVNSTGGTPSVTLAGLEIEATGGTPTSANAGAAGAAGTGVNPAGQDGTGFLFAGADAQISGTWANTAGAVGSTQGDYATWTDSGSGTSAVLELSTFGVQAAVPAGATVGDVTIRVRHSEDPAAQLASVTAQAYLGTTPYGSAQPLTLDAAVHEDDVTVTGLARSDLADLRVRVTATRN